MQSVQGRFGCIPLKPGFYDLLHIGWIADLVHLFHRVFKESGCLVRKIIDDIEICRIDQHSLKTAGCDDSPVDEQYTPGTHRVAAVDVLAYLFVNSIHDLVDLREKR